MLISDISENRLKKGNLKKEEIISLLNAEKNDINRLMSLANSKRENNFITYSKNIFIPLTEICRNSCGYCTFKKESNDPEAIILKNKKDIIDELKFSEQYDCKEALFTFGEQADEKEIVKSALMEKGFSSMVEYHYDICQTTLDQTDLLPHTNAGVLSYEDMKTLKEVNVSMGMMLENSSPRLRLMEAHKNSPGKDPNLRIKTIADAGKLKIPFTTGILIGIGETKEEIADSLLTIKNLHDKYGHIQEIIIQNFRSKPGIPMENNPEPSILDMIRTVSVAKLLFSDVSIQVPPNLNHETNQIFLLCGADDWGGISPVSKDYVNPEAPWPEIEYMDNLTRDTGLDLKERLAIYDKYINNDFLNEDILNKTIKLKNKLE
ncbi:7,8-didemethyl-8-hydroxy-5-deazariboflavin synthase subunit CofG [Methanobrevibacter sp. TMH8]|uniref:7,8-didemethyl-8-hydroxy-5-deazariboflavin synthase subunit CofG n=1 Tax=Methanobrevibacter sp. TMH8 TaxID=2848611 RepID=UPI001CD020BE|nr:7,8-didemethyl-8-hydroxy-5-deazariboflavin synthase subunit CofG [Methanobrevibacter sp. TMH8]MBZ9571441.1 7,8-didemethyl-8-hydroxy-5-deazariboflavin synthase subunit CofG [Methanobrevibacter sp. TMH8]